MPDMKVIATGGLAKIMESNEKLFDTIRCSSYSQGT